MKSDDEYDDKYDDKSEDKYDTELFLILLAVFVLIVPRQAMG